MQLIRKMATRMLKTEKGYWFHVILLPIIAMVWHYFSPNSFDFLRLLGVGLILSLLIDSIYLVRSIIRRND